MPDAFDAAASTVDQQKKALLAAMAAGGTAGAEAVKAAQADLAAQRTAAINAALAGATGRGAPAELTSQLSSTIAQPYDRATAALTAGAASRTGDLAARAATTSSYLGEVEAGIPASRAMAERQLAELRVKAAAKSGSDPNSKALPELSDAALTKRLLGAADLAKESAAARNLPTPQAIQPGVSRILNGKGTVQGQPLLAPSGPSGLQSLDDLVARQRAQRKQDLDTRAAPVEQVARNLGIQAGVDPVRAYGLLRPPTPSAAEAKKSADAAADAHRKTVYGRVKLGASKGTVFEFEKASQFDDADLSRQYVATLDSAYLKRNGISRQSLLRWLDDFYAKG